MHQHVGIVHRHPLGVVQPVHGKGLAVGFLAGVLLHRVHDGLHLAGRASLADDEVVADGVFYVGEVGNHDVLAFFLLDSFSDCFE